MATTVKTENGSTYTFYKETGRTFFKIGSLLFGEVEKFYEPIQRGGKIRITYHRRRGNEFEPDMNYLESSKIEEVIKKSSS